MRGYFSRRYIKYWLGLAILLVLGFILQLHNLSSYNFYPDSYQSLVVAQNLKTDHHLTATMGQGGLLYPDFFGWTRPIYPLLINFFSLFGLSLTVSAHVVAVIAGLLAILAVFGLARSLSGSAHVGLMAAALLSFSYSRAVWGGFIFTEPLGLLTLSLALWRLCSQRTKDGGWFNGTDALTGLIFAAAILTRYEYAAILLPAAFMAAKKWAPKRTLTIIITALYVIGMILVGLHAFSGGQVWVWQQIKDYVTFVPVGLLVAAVVAYLSYHRKINDTLEKWLARMVALIIVAGVIAEAVHQSFYPAIWVFARHEPLITTLTILGVLMLLLGKAAQRRLGLLLSAGMLILAVLYYRTNPTIDRYPTHLLPLALLAASYAAWHLLRFKYRPVIISLFILAAGLQIFKTWSGLHPDNNNIWFKTGYEERSAKIIASRANTTNLLLASMPEPYYIFSHIPTQSLTDRYPYLYISNTYDDLNVTVINDMGMQQIFPNFSDFLYSNLQNYQTSQYWVNAPFRYITAITPETDPVTLYQIKLADLKRLINSAQANQ